MELRNAITKVIENGIFDNNSNDYFRQPLVAFVSPDAFHNIKELAGEQHLYPHEFLSDVKTVISFFIPFTKKLIDTNKSGDKVSDDWAYAYYEGNKLLVNISKQVGIFCESLGINYALLNSISTFDVDICKADWSHRSAACVAGLGNFGLNRMLITEKGCAGRYGTILINEKIMPSTKKADKTCIYFETGVCKACVLSCPTKALTEKEFDRFLCHAKCIENGRNYAETDEYEVCGKCSVGPCAYFE